MLKGKQQAFYMNNTPSKISANGALCYVSVTTSISKSLEEVTARFDQRLFHFLAPAFPKLVIDRYDGQKIGDQVWLRIGFWPVFFRWRLRIVSDWQTADTWGFEDEGIILPLPLTAWRHQHRLTRLGENVTQIEDYVGFRAGPQWLTKLMAGVIRKQMEERRPLYQRYFCGESDMAST